MTIAFWCLFLAAILHTLTKMPLSIAQNEMPEGYDNNCPRRQQASLSDRGLRALGAHLNQQEAFPLFATGVIVAAIADVNQATADTLAITWIVLRLIYWGLYLTDRSTLRSLAWVASYTICLALICSPAWSRAA